MTVARPFRRTIRQFADGQYATGGRWMYIRHPMFCQEPEHFIRSFTLIQNGLIKLFEYVEPDDRNFLTYWYRIQELIVRTCIELEENFKAILSENGYAKASDLTIADYYKVESSHFLSQYQVKLPTWRTGTRIFAPFEAWAVSSKLDWYRDYNAVKHDRHSSFEKANLQNLLKAVTGLVALLSSQFYNGCFDVSFGIAAVYGPGDGYDDAVGGYFKVKWPENMPEEDRYDFVWQTLESQQDPFDNFPYGP